MNSPGLPIGQHLLADLWEIDADLLRDEDALIALFSTSLDAAGFTIVGQVSHRFPGEGAGVTAVFLLSQSHASIHTYPEHGYLALDVFSCGDARPAELLVSIERALSPKRTETHTHPRGVLPNG